MIVAAGEARTMVMLSFAALLSFPNPTKCN